MEFDAAIITAIGSVLSVIALAIKQWRDNRSNAKRSEIQALWSIVDEYKSRLATQEKKIEALEITIDELENENAELREQNNALCLEVASLKFKLERYRARLRAIDGQDGENENEGE